MGIVELNELIREVVELGGVKGLKRERRGIVWGGRRESEDDLVVYGGVLREEKEGKRERNKTERARKKRVGIVERSRNDAIRRVMQNDVTFQAGVTVLSQGQSVQGPAPCHHPHSLLPLVLTLLSSPSLSLSLFLFTLFAILSTIWTKIKKFLRKFRILFTNTLLFLFLYYLSMYKQ